MKEDRQVAGLWCHEVLDGLADYVDGELAPEVKEQVDRHLAGCDVCERFGGEYGAMVRALKRGADERSAADVERQDRLRSRLLEQL